LSLSPALAHKVPLPLLQAKPQAKSKWLFCTLEGDATHKVPTVMCAQLCIVSEKYTVHPSDMSDKSEVSEIDS